MAYYSDDDGHDDLEPNDDEFDDEDDDGCPGCGAGFDEFCKDDCPLIDDADELEEE